MKKLSKKYKIYLSCLGILLIIGIVFTFYSSSQEKKTIEQKHNIEKYVDSIVDSEKNITNKLNNIKNISISTIGDSDYIAEQIKNISDNNILLYNYQNDNIEYKRHNSWCFGWCADSRYIISYCKVFRHISLGVFNIMFHKHTSN